jgi:hypothetical protein
MFRTRSPRRSFRVAVVGLAVVGAGAVGVLAGGGTVAGASPHAEGHDSGHMGHMDHMAEMMESMDVRDGAPMGRMHAEMMSEHPGMRQMHADMVSGGHGRNG